MKIPLHFERMERPSLLVSRIDGSDAAVWRHAGRIGSRPRPADPISRSPRTARSTTCSSASCRALSSATTPRSTSSSRTCEAREMNERCGTNAKSSSAPGAGSRSWASRPAHEVLVLGVEADCTFMDELRERGAVVRTGGNKPMDMIFALFRHRNDLRRLPSLVPRLKADGVLWTLRPKGSDDLEGGRNDAGRVRMPGWST